MAHHNGRKFSAKDKDVDAANYNCAQKYKSGWWYGACHYENLNGLYLKGKQKSVGVGVNWNHRKGPKYSLKGTTMMVGRE